MARKKEIEEKKDYIKSPLEDIFADRFARYSKYIIQERALPDARDGLKPVQRRILYAMFHEGNTYEHAFRKSAKTVGIVIGNYHPHGDTSVYEAMVRLSQDWKQNLPLVEMHGNNGSIDDDPAAAMRYTEARLSKVTSTMEIDLDKDTVEFAPNFDDTEEEPTVLPARFPVLLVNGATGIAAGYATNIPTHNLSEVINAAIYRIQNPECELEDLMQIIPGPDFPTGGIVQGKQGIIDAFKTGRGRIVVRSKAEIVQQKTCQQIIITEIPFEVIKIQLVKKMDEIRINKDIDGILDVRDESDRNGLRIVVDVKNDINAEVILNYFYKNTDLQVYYNYNMIGIIDKTPVLMSLMNMLDCFIHHREEVVTRRSRYELKKMEDRCHVIEGLMKAVSIMDEIIATIRASKDKADSKVNLMKKFGFSDPQAEAIVNMRLYRLSNTDIKQLRDEFALLVNKIEEMKSILSNSFILHRVIINELKEIETDYHSERKTVIEDEIKEIVIDKASTITNERVMVTISRDGYVKRVSLRSYNSSEGFTGKKDTDSIAGVLECDTLDTLLLMTSKGNYAYLPVYQIDEGKWKDMGIHINKFIKMDGDDKIIAAINIKNFNTYAWIVTASARGNIKKTPVSQWQLSRNNKAVSAMKLKPQDTMIRAFLAYAHDEVIIVTKYGLINRYSTDIIPSTNVRSQGVKAISLGKEDEIVDACTIRDKSHLLFITENGQMKRIRNDLVLPTNRAVKGSRICKWVKTNPSLLRYVLSCNANDKLTFIADEKLTIEAKDVSIMTCENTFSTAADLKGDWHLLREVEECRIIDIPKDDTLMKDQSEEVSFENHDDFEMIDLFEDEK